MVYAEWWPCSQCGEVVPRVDGIKIHTNEQGGKQSLIQRRYDLIDPKAIGELARILYEGAQKYDDNNWRKIPTNDHINHALNHIYLHLAKDTAEDHLAHAFTRLMMAVAKEMET
ncbi:dATP/dGTP diphosphohydrolase domain-containing protein [Alicyclobacillus dauci]|uniref:DUF5664 domain-containing protein n=1 Tax=Alicyclobacillus dauci TaxID=1475485 RepID=A0ABY6YXC8_9BACL|nr:dATP/dGTP diphosphohydrolase domain-containing protein [Alicyclobacillus dauci]WAH35034.1 DUF5664 domain-containing protein [Alicyclobacillus dauci]